MARPEVNYDQRPEQLQTTASPNIVAELARRDTPGMRLADALGVAVPDIKELGKVVEDDQARQGREYANSLTLDELGEKIKNKELLPSQSPAFVATAQHLYGENALNRLETQTHSKIASGELQFKTPAEMDQYLTDARNEILAGHSRFAIAGFDKSWTKMRDKVTDLNAKYQDKINQKDAVVTVSQNLIDTLNTSQGSPTERVATAMEKYQFLRDTGVLNNPDTSKNALSNLAITAAEAGDVALTKELLNYRMDNGATLGTTIGTDHANHILNGAEHKFKVQQQEQLKAQILAKSFEDTKRATTAVETAIRLGTFSMLPDMNVMSPTGETKKFNAVEAAQANLQQREVNEKWSPEQRVFMYSSNNVPDCIFACTRTPFRIPNQPPFRIANLPPVRIPNLPPFRIANLPLNLIRLTNMHASGHQC